MTITVNDRQSLFDIALIALGGVAGVFDLAQRNNIPITASLADRQLISYEMTDVVSHNVRRAYALQSIAPATDIPRADYQELLFLTGSRRPVTRPRPSLTPADAFVSIDKLSEVIDSLAAGKTPAKAQSKQNLSRIFSNPFDETFA